MSFDINQNVFDPDGFMLEPQASVYRSDLLRLFARSPEADELAGALNGRLNGLWVTAAFLRMVHLYRAARLSEVDVRALRHIVFNTIPHNLMADGDEAENIILELQTFWIFLRRAFGLANADDCIKALRRRGVVNRLHRALDNPGNFGFSKAIHIEAYKAGVDLSDETSVSRFMEDFHRQFVAESPYLMGAPLTEEVKMKLGAVVMLIGVFCGRHLNPQYTNLCERMAWETARIHPSPLAKGGTITWAAATVYTICRINNCFDPRHAPHIRAKDICRIFGVSQSAVNARARQAMHVLQIDATDHVWTVDPAESAYQAS